MADPFALLDSQAPHFITKLTHQLAILICCIVLLHPAPVFSLPNALDAREYARGVASFELAITRCAWSPALKERSARLVQYLIDPDTLDQNISVTPKEYKTFTAEGTRLARMGFDNRKNNWNPKDEPALCKTLAPIINSSPDAYPPEQRALIEISGFLLNSSKLCRLAATQKQELALQSTTLLEDPLFARSEADLASLTAAAAQVALRYLNVSHDPTHETRLCALASTSSNWRTLPEANPMGASLALALRLSDSCTDLSFNEKRALRDGLLLTLDNPLPLQSFKLKQTSSPSLSTQYHEFIQTLISSGSYAALCRSASSQARDYQMYLRLIKP